MAQVPIQRITIPLPQRRGAQIEIAALAPFNPHYNSNQWQLNRKPYAHLTPVALGGRLGHIYLGEEAEQLSPEAPPGTVPAPAKPPAATRSPNVSSVPEAGAQRSFALLINRTSPAGETIGISTPALPYAYQIVGAELQVGGGVFTDHYLALLVTDDAFDGIVPNDAGYPIIEPRITFDGGIFGWQEAASWGWPLNSDLGLSHSNLAAQFVGATINDPNKHLTLAVHNSGALTAIQCGILLTIQVPAKQARVATTQILERTPAPPPTVKPTTAPTPTPTAAAAPTVQTPPAQAMILRQVAIGEWQPFTLLDAFGNFIGEPGIQPKYGPVPPQALAIKPAPLGGLIPMGWIWVPAPGKAPNATTYASGNRLINIENPFGQPPPKSALATYQRRE